MTVLDGEIVFKGFFRSRDFFNDFRLTLVSKTVEDSKIQNQLCINQIYSVIRHFSRLLSWFQADKL